MSRKHVIEGTRNSLKRLQLDYVDIVYAHKIDYDVPLEEQVRAFSWLIDNGLALYWGTSEWPGIKFEQACQIAEKLKLHKPVVEQCQYNMFWRDRLEKEYKPLFERRSMATAIWSPLCGGFLSGKYNDGKIPEDSRGALMYKTGGHLAVRADRFFGETTKEQTVQKLKALSDLAAAQGFTQSQLALAWSIANPDVSSAILGFSRVDQIAENLGAVKLLEVWTPEIEKQLNAILGNDPELETDWRTWKTENLRRSKL